MDRWHVLSLRASGLLREPVAAPFAALAQRCDDEISSLVNDAPEASLLLLIQGAGSDVQRYSTMHALLVTVVCELASQAVATWTNEQRGSLRRAALTMNIGMTRLQDQLAVQDSSVTASQRAQIQGHAVRGRELLSEMGATDELWLEAVAHHHDAPAGPLLALPVGLQLARLIQRADLFAARLSPRRLRSPLSAAGAAKGAYLDESAQPDDAGSLVIKALGVYPPGSYVQLANGEVAIVMRRSHLAGKPVVACIARAEGTPYSQPLLRPTHDKQTAITRGIPPHEVRVRVPVERLLRLMR